MNALDDLIGRIVPGTIQPWELFKGKQELHTVAELLAKRLVGSNNQPVIVAGPFLYVSGDREMWCRFGQRMPDR